MLRLITYIDSRERFPTQLCWDEENRLMSFADCENAGFYQYDAGGERTYKLTSDYVSQNIGGHWHTYQVLDNPTLYTSPYMVATPKGYTKHYYAESERVASRIGGGLDSVDMFIQNFEEFVDKPTVEISPLWTDEYHKEPFDEKRDHNLDHLYSAMECADNVPTVLFECLTILYKYSQHPHHEYEPDCYWYHPDHLGSSSWITYTDGSAVQHLHYLPWGENFVDQRSSTFDGARYTFSAKEKDAETGYSYFGSRYYNSDLSIWLSVDPMAAKYPSLSPYVYCANNPVKLVDPNGEEVYIKGEASEEATSQLQATTKNLVITRNEKTGKLSVEGKPKGRNERLLYRAIKSECVKVNIDAEYANKNKEGNYDVDGDPAVGSKGGSFMGNVIVKLNNSKKYVVTSQKVFPEALCEDFDDNGKYYGESIRHEVTESFIGGLISLRRGRPAPAAIFDKKIYNIAHRRATPQPSEETSSNEANEAITPGYKPYQRIYY